MTNHYAMLAACFGILGGATLAHSASALTVDQCEQLSGNAYLAAIERGECDINLQTAAGPDEQPVPQEGSNPDRNHDGRNGGRGGEGGGDNDGGGNDSGGSRDGGRGPSTKP